MNPSTIPQKYCGTLRFGDNVRLFGLSVAPGHLPVYLSFAGAIMACKGVWADLVGGKIVNGRLEDESGYRGAYLRLRPTGRKNAFVTTVQRIPGLEIDHYVMLDTRFFTPHPMGGGLLFYDGSQPARHKFFQMVYDLSDIPLHESWVDFMIEHGEHAIYRQINATHIGDEDDGVKVFLISAQKTNYRNFISSALSQEKLTWPN